MKQVLQNLSDGSTVVADVPVPRVSRGNVLIKSSTSLISSGTERLLIEFGKANLLDKARQQPDKLRMVIDKIKTDGLIPAIEAVRNKLDQPLPLGYCNVGVITDVGNSVRGFAVGDRVVSNGPHAEFVSVPKNLCALVPKNVPDDHAVFTVLAAIGLQGIRLANPTLGECIVVTGLGLIGLLTVQMLRAQGCRVLGIDFDSSRLAIARSFGADTVDLSKSEDPIAVAASFSRRRGVDAVLITASSKSNEPVRQAARMCRKRGRIILIGVTGLELSRADFYEKELTFQVSCSYGPGRYDPSYEERGQDYPVGFVRWTEQRNFEAVLELMASGDLDLDALISHRFALDEADAAYDLVIKYSPLGILLEYGAAIKKDGDSGVSLALAAGSGSPASSVVAMIGAGNYASKVLIPAFKNSTARLATLASERGVSSAYLGRKYGFAQATTDAMAAIDDIDVNTVVIATRHDSHAELTCHALKQGKHVFVEKPLAVTREQLEEVVKTYEEVNAAAGAPILTIGFNRRFAPQVLKLKGHLTSISEPKSLVMTVNAGGIPKDHWVHDPIQGGGRIIGEGCHFLDLLRFLVGFPITRVHAVMMGNAPGLEMRDDKATISLEFADGSFGTVHYLANGHRSYPKERLEVFCRGAVIELNNFRRMTGFGWPGFRKMNLRSQDKGHTACVLAFVKSIEQGLPPPIPFDEIVEVSKATFDAVDRMYASL